MADALTPMMQQYQRLRGSVPADVLLLFRLGDFYELFFEDAKEAASLLNVALTKRNGVPMCGVPYHAAPNYIAKLIKAGKRGAICDQTSAPRPGRIGQTRQLGDGALMGGISFHKGLGVVHSLAHALGAEGRTHHGTLNAILLPHALRFNREAAGARMAELASRLGLGRGP